ncbi:MAG: flavin reductase family protein [Lachnospiraceae bacterium]|nr:flavin reductase family protein [Lachnospiraceae bacterium]
MKKINLPQASRLTSPNPLTIVCTQKPDGTTNLATVSWWTYLSFNPNMIAYAMAKTSYSGEMVRNNHKVILTIPGAAMAEAAMKCGSTTGRDTDKAGTFGIELADVEGSTIKIPVHSRVAIQCSMKEYHEVGDHYLYICDVEQVYGNAEEEALFAWNGYSKIAPAKQE